MSACDSDHVILGTTQRAARAARLRENPTVTVCLPETVGHNNSTRVNLSAARVAIMPHRNKYNCAFDSEPNTRRPGRASYQPRGKGLGGSRPLRLRRL